MSVTGQSDHDRHDHSGRPAEREGPEQLLCLGPPACEGQLDNVARNVDLPKPVVYAVLVETGLTDSNIGKIIMASTVVTDMGTALALSLTVAEWSMRTLWFLLGSALIIAVALRYLPRVFERYGTRVIEPEIKLLFFVLFVFMALGRWGQSHAVLPVFVLGLGLATMFREHKELQRKLRIVAFAMITPFFFIKGGMNVSVLQVAENWLLLVFSGAARTHQGGTTGSGRGKHLITTPRVSRSGRSAQGASECDVPR